MREWNNCGEIADAGFFTLSAAPEGRECVVLLQIGVLTEADREAAQHILDTFEADCGKIAESASTDGSVGAARPSSVFASGTSPPAPDAGGQAISYEPEKAVDGRADTAWNVDGDGIGEYITLEYDEPVEVGHIGIIPGYDKVDPEDDTYRFYQLYVVKRAEIEFSDGSTAEADFERDPTIQFVDVPEIETDYVKITILESYPPGDPPDGSSYPYTLDKIAISEIEVET